MRLAPDRAELERKRWGSLDGDHALSFQRMEKAKWATYLPSIGVSSEKRAFVPVILDPPPGISSGISVSSSASYHR